MRIMAKLSNFSQQLQADAFIVHSSYISENSKLTSLRPWSRDPTQDREEAQV